MALLLSQHKVINRLTELISKQKSLDSNNKEVKESKEGEQELGRENKHDYIRMKEFIIMMIISKREIDCAQQFILSEFPSG